MEINWLSTLRRYIVASIAAHLAWEILQLPFYTIWTNGTPSEIAFAVLHCTLGDGMIAALSLLAALTLAGRQAWPNEGARGVFATMLVLGVVYTIYSEWMNVSVRRSWAYSPLMPNVPIIGTGLSPLLQWVFVPVLALAIAIRRAPWRDRAR